MSVKIMIIDEFYQMETRVAVLCDDELDAYGHELSHNRPKKGNIYWGKIVQIVPSLQAAFVDFGEEKHGFLPFAEVHPQWYGMSKKEKEASAATALLPAPESMLSEDGLSEDVLPPREEGESEAKPVAQKRRRPTIQSTLKVGQSLFVQVVKDVRGNKGAALTTYISLPGKYSVLMPNTPGSTGVSRKITSATERAHLKKVIEGLSIPDGMSIIVRTAALNKANREIKRDCDYLVRLWKKVSQVKAASPFLVYEESNLLIRALRDWYSTQIEKVLIQGKEAFVKAQGFMRTFMPTHLKRVFLYDEKDPLFQKFHVEEKIEKLYHDTLELPSGGEIVIHPTEALVAIDVNSARFTRESYIEETAVKTNIEAARAVAHQLRLRDISGLIVIDFIDMNDGNKAKVEKVLKEALKEDQARIQMGKITDFGLLEMSRQRLRTSLVERSFMTCHHCHGKGHTFSHDLIAMRLFREIVHWTTLHPEKKVFVDSSPDLASYILNEHRDFLTQMETDAHVKIKLLLHASFLPGTYHIRSVPEEISGGKNGEGAQKRHQENGKKEMKNKNAEKKNRGEKRQTSEKEQEKKVQIPSSQQEPVAPILTSAQGSTTDAASKPSPKILFSEKAGNDTTQQMKSPSKKIPEEKKSSPMTTMVSKRIFFAEELANHKDHDEGVVSAEKSAGHVAPVSPKRRRYTKRSREIFRKEKKERMEGASPQEPEKSTGSSQNGGEKNLQVMTAGRPPWLPKILHSETSNALKPLEEQVMQAPLPASTITPKKTSVVARKRRKREEAPAQDVSPTSVVHDTSPKEGTEVHKKSSGSSILARQRRKKPPAPVK